LIWVKISRSGGLSPLGQALINHRLAARSAFLIPPTDDLTDRFLELVPSRLTAEAEPRFALGKLALDLHCSARTLQNRLRSELDASPREVWTALLNQQRANG
jgi:AraC-like DNA-binding protein